MSADTATNDAARRHRSAYFYSHYCGPKVSKFPLHSATYNGRVAKIQSILQQREHCVHQLASDAADDKPTSALFIALARQHSQIAHLYLDIVSADLQAIQQHFDQLEGGTVAAESRFWLNERILIAFGQDHIDYALREASRDLVQSPDEMTGKTGLLILLKPDNHTASGVLWLSCRQPGADRRIARIVDHIYQRGGELSLQRRELWDHSLLDVAARMDLAGVWLRLRRIVGPVSRRHLVTSWRYLAEHSEGAQLKREKFRALCEGDFPLAEIFGQGDEADILYDAINQYKGDFTILEYLIELAVAGGRKEAANVVDQIVVDRGCDRSLLSVAFQLEDKDLPWKLLKYQPDLVSCCTEWWDTPANRFISQRPFDEAVHQLILAQLPTITATEEFRSDLLVALMAHNWEPTVRELFRRDASYRELFERMESDLGLLVQCSRQRQYDVLQFLLTQCQSDAEKRFSIAERIIGELRESAVPEVFWSLVEGESEKMHELLFTALRNRRLDLYRRLLELLPADVRLSDIRNATNESLLFAAIYDRTHRTYDDCDYVETESAEVIDSDDDEAAAAHKTAENLRRTPADNNWKGTLASNLPLELAFEELFRELLAAGLDAHHLDEQGRSLAHVAVERDNLCVLQLLTELRVNLSHSDRNGGRPMHCCSTVAAFRALPPADVLALNDRAENPMLAYLRLAPYYEHNEELLRLFIEAGSDVRQADSSGETALHLCRLPEIARRLLEAGADVNAPNDRGDTPSHCAFRLRDRMAEIVRLLFAHPDHDVFRLNAKGVSLLADIVCLNETDFAGIRELMGEERLARLLARHCNLPTDQGFSLLIDCQQDEGNLHCLRVLLDSEKMQLIDPAEQRCQLCADDEGRYLVECGAHWRNRVNKTPLDWSGCLAEGGDWLAQLRLFGAAGANLEMTNSVGETALQWYCWMGEDKRDFTRILARLLEAGAKYRKLTIEGVPVLRDTVFRSLYEWDEERGEAIEQQVFQSKWYLVGQ